MTEENKGLFQHWFDELNKGNVDGADAFFAPDYVLHEATSGDIRGLNAFKEYVASWLKAFPDAQLTIEDLTGEGDRVVAKFTFRGTHKGEMMGIAPSGKQVIVPAIAGGSVAEGKFAEAWQLVDTYGLLQQLGARLQQTPAEAGPKPPKAAAKKMPKPKVKAKKVVKPKPKAKSKAVKKTKAKRSR